LEQNATSTWSWRTSESCRARVPCEQALSGLQNEEFSVLTRMMKLVSIAALLLAAMLWNYAPAFELPLRFVIGLSALLVATQAVRAKKYYWAVGFYAVALLFNPFVVVITLSGKLSLLVVFATVALFAVSLAALKTQPLLSMPSITGQTPRSESL
jgi:Sec-independent protein secretion pathway component TatC